MTINGVLLAGYRSTKKGGVCEVSRSEDSGISWHFELELELPRGSWDYGGYPTFVDLPDGTLFVSFHNAVPSWYVAYNILAE